MQKHQRSPDPKHKNLSHGTISIKQITCNALESRAMMNRIEKRSIYQLFNSLSSFKRKETKLAAG